MLASLCLADEKIRRLEEQERILLKKLAREEDKHKRELEIYLRANKNDSIEDDNQEVEKIVEKYERKINEIQKESEILKVSLLSFPK